MGVELDGIMIDIDKFFAQLKDEGYSFQSDERGNPIASFSPKVFSTDSAPLSEFRYLNPRIAAKELYWMLHGSGSTPEDREAKVTPEIEKIWAPWAGDMGPMYGVQWRYWCGGTGLVDQLQRVTERLKDTPTTRRAVISAWAAHEIDSMKLPPCPTMWTFSRVGPMLHLSVFCRSTDLVCGFPYNAMHSWLFLQTMSREIGAIAGSINLYMANPHIYVANWEIAQQWMRFVPADCYGPKPTILLKKACTGWNNFDPKYVGDVFNDAPVIHPEVVV